MTRKSSVAAHKFAIEGELTIFRAAELREALLGCLQSAGEIEVDLSGVAEFDTAGLQLMIAAKREAVQRGKQLHFANHSKPVLDLLDLCDLAGYFGDQIVISSSH